METVKGIPWAFPYSFLILLDWSELIASKSSTYLFSYKASFFLQKQSQTSGPVFQDGSIFWECLGEEKHHLIAELDRAEFHIKDDFGSKTFVL